MPWDFNNRTPVFLQIVDRIRMDIVSGKYPVDGQIPPVRQLAFDAAVNPNTMQRALSVLEEEGLLYSKGTVGRFVTSDKDILAAALERMKIQALSNALDELHELGVTDEELIGYIRTHSTTKEVNSK